MKTLVDEILEIAKSDNVTVFFDMDGTCVEYIAGEKDDILSNKPGLYLDKRPIKTVVKIMEKLSKNPNIKIKILSNCHFKEQKEEKILWLQKNLPFISKEDVHIIVLSEENYTKETKDFLKAKFILKMNLNSKIFLIEDNLDIIKASRKMGVDAHHVSRIIE